MRTHLLTHSNEINKSRVYPENSGAETDVGKVIYQFHLAIKSGDNIKVK